MAENETHSRRPVSPAEIRQKLPPVEGRLGTQRAPRSPHAACSWRAGRFRARPDPRQDGRGQEAGAGARRQVRLAAASQSLARHPSLVPSPAPSLASRRLRDASAPRPARRSARVRVRSCPKTFVAVPAPGGGVPRPGCSGFHIGAASASSCGWPTGGRNSRISPLLRSHQTATKPTRSKISTERSRRIQRRAAGAQRIAGCASARLTPRGAFFSMWSILTIPIGFPPLESA